MDNNFIIVVATSLLLVALCLKRRKRIRRFWVNSYLRGRRFSGRHNDVSDILIKPHLSKQYLYTIRKLMYVTFAYQFVDMRSFPPSFRENFHMTHQDFEAIYNKIKRHLEPIKYSRPDIISPRAKLAMVLECVFICF